MKILRAITFGICIFVTAVVLGEVYSIIAMSIMGAEKVFELTKSFSFFLIGQIVMTAIIALFTYLYLIDKKIKRKTVEGFYFGLTAGIIGTLIGIFLRLYFHLIYDMAIEIFPNPVSLKFWEAILYFAAIGTIIGFLTGKYSKIHKRKK